MSEQNKIQLFENQPIRTAWNEEQEEWYDALSQPLPNPIWWISGDSELAGDFAERFICHLKKLSKAMEVTEP